MGTPVGGKVDQIYQIFYFDTSIINNSMILDCWQAVVKKTWSPSNCDGLDFSNFNEIVLLLFTS
jgi:hypothetical protein